MAGGGSKPGERRGGRQKGTPNKATAPKSAFMAAFVAENRAAAEAKWHEIEDPAVALNLYLKASEFVHPKRAAVALTGEDGGPVVVEIRKYTESE